MEQEKKRAPRNRTTVLTEEDKRLYTKRLVVLDSLSTIDDVIDKTIHQDIFEAAAFLPGQSVDLMIVDPPYNLNKKFNGSIFSKRKLGDYEEWIESWLSGLVKLLKPSSSIYICGDWQSSTAVHRVVEKYFYVRNRITWEREKGRGAKANWKNCSEDIWFCTVSNDYTFNVDAVKMKRKVIAPYTDSTGKPKDWKDTTEGKFRITHPSNLWTDISIPFWSMPENTDHPTQKPEKLIAKMILASSNTGDVVFDPFLGSGTTSVVSRKLQRRYFGVEMDLDYCCLAEKRLEMAELNNSIQGYSDNHFWERNTLAEQLKNGNGCFERKDSNVQRALLPGMGVL